LSLFNVLDFSTDCVYVIPTGEGPQKDTLSSHFREVTACGTVPQAIWDKQSHVTVPVCAEAEQKQRLWWTHTHTHTHTHTAWIRNAILQRCHMDNSRSPNTR